MKKNILLTGPPGVGKTTAIRKLAYMLSSPGAKVHGFYTEEIRESGKRKGFRIATLDNQTGTLAHVDGRGKHQVGRYRVNLEDLEKTALPSILPRDEADEIIIIDEIGTMELKSRPFQKALLAALDSSALVLATIKLGGHPLINRIKSRSDVILIEINMKNRDAIPSRLSLSLTSNH